jgi:hypothetical protein
MNDADHLRAKAREFYDFAKRARYVDDGLLCILNAMQLERDADELEQARVRDSQVRQRRADLAVV